MAIGTDSAVEVFGTQDSLDDTSGSVADAAFSAASDLLTWTNDDDAVSASVVLEATFGSSPDANSSVTLFAQMIDIQSTSDQLVPTANFQHVFIGTFPVKDVTSAQFIPVTVGLPNNATSQIYQFFIQNNAGQTISAGWDIHITPTAIGPHA